MASAAGIRLGKVFVEIGADPSKLFGTLNKLNKRIGSIGQSMTNFGGRMTAIGGALAAPLALASRQFASFDDAIRATAAVTGSLGPQGAAALAMLNDKARELGATTSFTAVQVANLMTELGRAGFNPQEINDMTGAVMDLARATGTDATLSAGIMAATLRQFGMGASDAARAADVLTYAANSSFNTVEGLGESLKFAGPVAKNLGMSLEDTVGILGVLGNVGIQGSEAGTALRRLGVISAGSGKQLQQLFGVSNTDAAGNLKPLVDILDDINTATSTMSVAERTEKMAKAFGLLGITSANVLAGSAPSVRAFIEGMSDIDRLANKSAKAMDAGLGGAIRILLSAVEGTALAIGEALAPSLERIVRGFTDVLGGITNFISKNEELVVAAAKGIAIFTGVGAALIGIGSAIQLASFSIGGLLTAFVAIPAAVLSAAASLVTYMVAATTAGIASTAAAVASAAAWVAASAPLLLVVGGIAAAAVAVYAFGSQIVSALSGVPNLIGRAASAIGSGFNSAVADGMAVLGDLATTAQTTFSGIYAAIADGDMAGAMDILWAGLYAAWLRGEEALMNAIDPWVSLLQNTFTYLSANVLTIWDAMIEAMANSWDYLEATVRKGQNFLQAAFQGADATALNDVAIDNEMADRRRRREEMRRDRTTEADTTAADRNQRNEDNRRRRRQETQAAEQNVAGMTAGKKEERVQNQQYADLLDNVQNVTTMDGLRGLYDEYDALSSFGRLTPSQIDTLDEAFTDAQERISQGMGDMTSGGRNAVRSAAGAGGAEAAQSASEVAGTFSSVGLGGMGFGGNLQQQQLDTLKEIADNTANMDGGAAVE